MIENVSLWDGWNASDGPKYPHEKVFQFIFRRFPTKVARERATALDLCCGGGVHNLFLVSEGFNTFVADISPICVINTLAPFQSSGLQGIVAEGMAQSINYSDASFH